MTINNDERAPRGDTVLAHLIHGVQAMAFNFDTTTNMAIPPLGWLDRVSDPICQA
jgi:hypothetical protein